MSVQSEVIRRIARRIPEPLRRLRARMLLDCFAARLGVVEVVCPACRGSGRLDARSWKVCPVCRGFEEVPVGLAEWFDEELETAMRPEGTGDAGRLVESTVADGPRCGLSGEISYYVAYE